MPNQSSGFSWNPNSWANRWANAAPSLRGVVQRALPQPVAQLVPGGLAVAEGRVASVSHTVENRTPMSVGWFRAMYTRMGLIRLGVQVGLWLVVIGVLLLMLPVLASGFFRVVLAILMPILLIVIVISIFGGGGNMVFGAISGVIRMAFGIVGSGFRVIGQVISGVADSLVKSTESWMHHIERQYARPVPITTFFIDLKPNAPSAAAWGRLRVDARIRGDMVGGTIRNGEEVRLEGREEHGILQVVRGQNITSGATIVIQGPWTV